MSGDKKVDVGGQAVIEGVMMRSPRSFTVVCRRPDQSIVIREAPWQPVWRKFSVLRWPTIRGAVVLFESLVNGLSALTFSADQQEAVAGTEGDEGRRDGESDGRAAARASEAPAEPADSSEPPSMVATIGFSLLVAIVLFVGVPHLVSWGLGTLMGYDATSMTFHAVDGVIKLVVLVGYMYGISLIPEIRRVFQYHGAEHKAIFTHELGLDLTVANARQQSRFHPRCGTSFLLIVVMVSVVVFSATLSFQISTTPVLDHLLKILIKIPMVFPIAGISYELIKLAGRHWESSQLARVGSLPGMWMQRITTREPDDSQLEIALISIRKTLWREAQDEVDLAGEPQVEVYSSAAEIDLPLAA